MEEKGLLDLKETAKYLGLGMTKTREIMKRDNCPFSLRIGNRLYSNKSLLDEHLARAAKYNIDL